MKRRCLSARCLVLVALAAVPLTGCRNLNHTQNGALVGSGLGATLGAIIGHQSGNRDKGALVGGALGAIGGGLAGQAQQNAEDRDDALSYAHHQHVMREAEQRAMTNQDVINLAQNTFSDQHIIRIIQDRNGRFELSTASQIVLKQSGVSEAVIGAMMQYNLNR